MIERFYLLWLLGGFLAIGLIVAVVGSLAGPWGVVGLLCVGLLVALYIRDAERAS